MSIRMLVFDYRENEKPFFENNELQNFEFTFFENSLNSQTVKDIPQDIKDRTTVISVFTNSQVTPDVIDAFKNLRIISTRSTAYDHISQSAAKDKNIAILNVENYGAAAVAQYTFGLLISLVRNIVPAALLTKGIKDACYDFTGRNLSELSIGIIGTGATGSSVCQIAHNFNMKIFGHDINERNELIQKFNLEYLTLEEIMKKSDIITVHMPYTGTNRHMIGEKEFALMKENSYFINTSSCELVLLEELYKNLLQGKILGAGLDVLVCEYASLNCVNFDKNMNDIQLNCLKENNFLKKINDLPNVIVTPHIAYNTQKSIDYILQNTIDQIREIIKSGHIFGVV